MGMKYIILKVQHGGVSREWPVIFPDMMVHKDVAEIMKFSLIKNHELEARVVSAGSLSFFGGEVVCSGESETLDVESRPEDAHLIKMFDYLHGIV